MNLKNGMAIDGTALIKKDNFKGLNRVDLAIISILMVLAFLLNFMLESKFFSLGVIDQWDVIFGADPISYLNELANGWGGGKRGSFSHPNYSNFFNPIIRILSKVVIWLSPGLEEASVRKQLALIIMPLASMLQTIFVYLIMRRLNFTQQQSLAISLLGIVSFSQIIFGSLPESFGLSSLAIACGIFLMVGEGQHKDGLLPISWISLQVFAIGITITNIIPISILHFSKLYGSELKPWNALLRSAATAFVGIMFTIVISYTFDLIYQAPKNSNRDIVRKEAIRLDPIRRFIAFPNVLADTLIATQPRIVENEPAIQNHHRFPYTFTFEGTTRPSLAVRPLASALLVAILIGGLMLMKGSPVEWITSLALFGIITYNWLFHSIWGTELFLYSGHWLVPELILLGGFFRFPSIPNTMLLALSITIIVGVAVNNATISHFILTTLSR